MKKFAYVLVFGTLMSLNQSSFAAQAAHAKKTVSWQRPYGLAGCGLGSLIVGKGSGQIFAATTNGTVWNQTFGITFNTSNCEDGPNNEVAQRMDTFVVANKVAIASDVARGSGETLVNLSAMMGCGEGNIQLGSTLQKNFREIFPTAQVQPNEVTDSIITVIKNDEGLSAQCKNIS